MTSIVITKDRVLTEEQVLELGHTKLLAKYGAELALFRRLPELFRKRRWPVQDDLMAVALAAVCYMKAGLFGEVLDIPAAAADRNEWRDLVVQGRAACTSIVADLDLGELLDP